MYQIAVRRNDTGEIQLSPIGGSWNEYSMFWWTEGNPSSDRSLHQMFIDAGGKEKDFIVDCDNRLYTPLHAVLDTGERIMIPTER